MNAHYAAVVQPTAAVAELCVRTPETVPVPEPTVPVPVPADCGGTGEPPFPDTGCEKGRPAEAVGGVCIDGCGDPYWACCDAPSRCQSHDLTCVARSGEDLTKVPFHETCVPCGGLHEPACTEPGSTPCEEHLWKASDGICYD